MYGKTLIFTAPIQRKITKYSEFIETGSLDNAVNIGLAILGYESLYDALDYLGRIYLFFFSFFYILGAFQIKQLFRSRFLDVR